MVNLLALTVFATIDEAAISGLKHAAAICNPQYECGGVVRAVEGGFVATNLISSKRPFGVDLGEFYGPDVVADFHTHICSVHNRAFADFFSASDAIVNQELHTVGYMLSLCDWNIRRFDPSQDDRDDEEVDFRSGRVIYLTIGHIVGWVPDDGATAYSAATDEPVQSQSGRENSSLTARARRECFPPRFAVTTSRLSILQALNARGIPPALSP
jgi:hypothetical protein